MQGDEADLNVALGLGRGLVAAGGLLGLGGAGRGGGVGRGVVGLAAAAGKHADGENQNERDRKDLFHLNVPPDFFIFLCGLLFLLLC